MHEYSRYQETYYSEQRVCVYIIQSKITKVKFIHSNKCIYAYEN